MEIINAKELEKSVHNEVKENKFEKMLSIQMGKIKDNMKMGRNSVVWVFSDIEYYHNDLEKSWFKEFDERAKVLFEDAGYKINSIVIRW